MRTTRPQAFTLLELLVVLAILALLIGLLLPAVQRVRTSAARTQCANNLRQLAVATQNYHSAHGRLPTGVGSVSGPNATYPFMNWHARLLPYLEQSALWEQTLAAYQQNPQFTANPPHAARESVLTVFGCPADSRTKSPGPFGYGLTSYLGVAGRNTARQDGLLYMNSEHRLTDITDGTSNTLLIGERPPSTDLRFGWWYAGWGQNKDGECDGVLGVRTEPRLGTGIACEGMPELFQPGKFDNQCDMFHFWSPHTGGANFAFADGSVRFLKYSADDIMPALATRAGGEAVTLPD
ncbi:MAG: DUF1559 domain-containing protein [Planctomycetia bacterium]|nr:DUF1559 domain-containing protein [Planctomycetia bacterium]